MQPGVYVLLKGLLGLEAVGDDDERALRKLTVNRGGEKGPGGWTDAGTKQCAALLQSPGKGLHGGSLREAVEQAACRRRSGLVRQAGEQSQQAGEASSGGRGPNIQQPTSNAEHPIEGEWEYE